ncbi:MAG: hypothetical protein WCG48_00770 [Candidatus Berkelbacteria bacterium]
MDLAYTLKRYARVFLSDDLPKHLIKKTRSDMTSVLAKRGGPFFTIWSEPDGTICIDYNQGKLVVVVEYPSGNSRTF